MLLSQNELTALTNLRAEVRNYLLETYEVAFVQGLETGQADIDLQKKKIEEKSIEFEQVMIKTGKLERVTKLKLEFVPLSQGLDEVLALVKENKVLSAKSKILKTRENFFNRGFIRESSELMTLQKAATFENSNQLLASIAFLQNLLIVFSILAIAVTILLTSYFSKTVGHRLLKLEEATLKIANGDFSHRLVENGSDEISGLAIAFNKMTASLTKAEDALLNQQSILNQASRMAALGELAGGVAHEINTPLAVIQMRTDQLLESANDGTLDPEILNTALVSIDQTVNRIGKIINGLKSFSRDGGKDPLILFSINQIVEDIFSLCHEKFKNQEIELKFRSLGEYQLMCRPTEIGQVLLNLVNNSYDAIQAQSEKWVEISVLAESEMLKMIVTDSGKGIPKEIQEKIMQPFFTTKEIGKGTGLGLSISKGIVENHGGKIKINNESRNTSIMVEFPLQTQLRRTA